MSKGIAGRTTRPEDDGAERVARDGYVLKVWDEGGHLTAIAGTVSDDGTWWPVGIGKSGRTRELAITNALVEAEDVRRGRTRFVDIGEDSIREQDGRTVEGYGPGIFCAQCASSSVITGVWFWGYDGDDIGAIAAADVDHWLCPVCAARAGVAGDDGLYFRGRAGR